MNERIRGKAAVIAAFLTFLVLFGASAVASVNISPLRVYLSGQGDKETVRFQNAGGTTKSYEVEVVAWSQTDERREVYSPTEDVVAVPPLFTLEPGEEQLVRIGLLGESDAELEKAYRVFITELAPPRQDEPESVGIAMRLRVGVPVFVSPAGLPRASLAYVDSTEIGDNHFARFRNTGNRHIKVTEVHYSGPGMAEPTVTEAVVYILAGQSAYLPVDIPGGSNTGTITVVADGLGDLEYELAAAN